MQTLKAEILIEETFLVVDDATHLSKDIQASLKQIFRINDLRYEDFKYDFVMAISENAFAKISESKNILVSTTFTTIKSNSFEDFINAGIKHEVKDKNVFSLIQFSIVGSDFEYYKEEITELYKNNVCFYFLNDNCTEFELYNP